MIPDVPREALIDAIQTYDDDHRGQPEWANWEENVKYKYAIQHEGKLYPVKFVVSLATGVERTSFSGGHPANSYVQARGFTVVPLREPLSRDSILELFRGIQTWKDGSTIAVHKPLVVLYALARYEDGAGQFVPYSDIDRDLRILLSEFGPERGSQQTVDPFWRLQNDGVWEVVPQELANTVNRAGVPSRGALLRANAQGGFLEDIYNAIAEDPLLVDAIRDVVLTTHMPDWSRSDVMNAVRSVALEARGSDMAIQEGLETVLSRYMEARQSEAFGRSNPLWDVFSNIRSGLAASPSVRSRPTLHVSWSMGAGNWAKVPWIAFLDSRETKSTQHGVYVVYLFRQDMSGVYLTFNQGVTELRQQHGVRESRKILLDKAVDLREHCSKLIARGFALDNEIDMRADRGLGAAYESSTIAHKFYPASEIPNDAALIGDLEAVLSAYDDYLTTKEDPGPGLIETEGTDFSLADSFDDLVQAIRSRGFYFEPWQIAQFITAARTKPFVILAGVSGTGKSKLPALVASATGAEYRLIPVRPDWTDSADVLGYVDLEGRFRAGAVMEVFRQAADEEDQHWFCIVDEMNLARVEQYFAEVLSRIEERKPADGGGYASPPLLGMPLPHGDDSEWAELGLPRNVTIVGTVNMDETTHGFSRKVLDRAFTIELSDIDLSQWETVAAGPVDGDLEWPLSVWQPRAASLGEVGSVSDEDKERIEKVIETLSEANAILSEAQLQVGYRSRDEIALFLLHASEVPDAFRTAEGNEVDPLDLAIQMKVLPRIIGGSGAVRKVLLGLLGWATTGSAISSDSEARDVVDGWISTGRGGELAPARFPRTAARLCLMWERLEAEGFTSFWL